MGIFQKFLLIVFLLSSIYAVAQNGNDTNYYVTTGKYLSAGVAVSERSYQLSIEPDFPDVDYKPGISYLAEARTAAGIALDYRKIALNIMFRAGKTDPIRKGKTNYGNIALNIGANRFLTEISFRNYQGFYDENSSEYIPGFNSTTPYYQSPDLQAVLLRIKTMYFTNWKKFAYKAAYSLGYRQRKTAVTGIFSAGLFRESFKADSSFIPLPLRNYYPGMEQTDAIISSGLFLGAGGSATIVFLKYFFLNLTFLPGAEFQKRTYGSTNTADHHTDYISFSGTLRSALGFNSERFVISLNSGNDFHSLRGKHLEIEPSFISGQLMAAYRFDVSRKK